MTELIDLLPYIQIFLAIFLIVLVLLQKSDSDAGTSFGGSDSETYSRRRGGERFIFFLTFAVAVLFLLSVLFSVIS